MRAENIASLFIIAVVIAAAALSFARRLTGRAGCCGGAPRARPKPKKLEKPIGRLVVRIDGMRCESCRRSVEQAINGIEGVSARVSLSSASARVSFEREIGYAELADAIESAGFDAGEVICKKSGGPRT